MNKKVIIGIALLLIVGIGSIAFFTLHQRQKKDEETSSQKRTEYDSALKTLTTEKKYLRAMAARLGVNFFSRHSDSSETDISFFMFNRISKLANKWRVQLVSFSPAEKEEKGGYTRISFTGEISATYLEMVHFFQELEAEEKLFINDLKVTTSSPSPRTHQAQFQLSCYEFSDPLLENLEAAEEISSLSSPEDQEMVLMVRRDPFVNPFKDVEVTRVEQKRQAGVIDLSGELSLTGITSFPKPRTAIIDHKMVRKGDQINGKQVMEIEEDQVILQAGEQRYILKMRGVAFPKSKEGNLLELQKETE